MSIKKTLIQSLASCCLLFALNTSRANNLPDLGSTDLTIYNSQTETRFGDAFSSALHTHYPLLNDPETLNYIREMGHHIASKTGINRHFKFYIIDNPSINAFAGPNGIIGIHTGLIMSASSEDELASVIAHEIAHVTQNHLSRQIEQNSSLSTTRFATLIAAILVGSKDANAGFATLMGGMGATAQTQLKNSRIHEHEADYIGIQYLAKSGYQPHAMTDFFRRLDSEGQANPSNMAEILSTHPVTSSRLAQSEDRALQFKAPKHPKDPLNELTLIKIRLHHLSQTTRLSEFQLTQLKPAAACYNQYLTNAIHANTAKAINCKSISAKSKLAKLAIIDTITKPSTKLAQLLFEQALYPNDPTYTLKVAMLLEQNGNMSAAIDMLTKYSDTTHYPYVAFQQLSKLYGREQKKAEAYYFNALANQSIGNIKYAKHLIDKANENNPDTTSKLTTKITQLQAILSEKYKNRLK